MNDHRHDIQGLRASVAGQGYVIDERAVATAILSRPAMRLFLAPPELAGRPAA